jgi:hypothetical protein
MLCAASKACLDLPGAGLREKLIGILHAMTGRASVARGHRLASADGRVRRKGAMVCLLLHTSRKYSVKGVGGEGHSLMARPTLRVGRRGADFFCPHPELQQQLLRSLVPRTFLTTPPDIYPSSAHSLASSPCLPISRRFHALTSLKLRLSTGSSLDWASSSTINSCCPAALPTTS